MAARAGIRRETAATCGRRVTPWRPCKQVAAFHPSVHVSKTRFSPVGVPSPSYDSAFQCSLRWTFSSATALGGRGNQGFSRDNVHAGSPRVRCKTRTKLIKRVWRNVFAYEAPARIAGSETHCLSQHKLT
jgi:hypothetical protein